MTAAASVLQGKPPVWDTSTGSVDHYYWYYGAQAVHQFGGLHWTTWRQALKEAVVKQQRRDGNFGGSWDPVGVWGEDGGRVYSTALLTLALQAEYRYHELAGIRAEPEAGKVSSLEAATALLDAKRFQEAFDALDVLVRKPPRTQLDRATTIIIAKLRRAEAMRGLAERQIAVDTKTAEKKLLKADKLFRELSRTRKEISTSREGTSLRAVALRHRVNIHANLGIGYHDLAMQSPRVATYASKARQHKKKADELYRELSQKFADAMDPNGRRIVDLTRADVDRLR